MKPRKRYNYSLIGIGVLFVLSCKSATSRDNQPSRLQNPITYSVEELDSLFVPLRKDTFILSVGHDEFRAPIEDLFSEKERIAHQTPILEYTWNLGRDSLLTVWYLSVQDSLKVLGKFTYPRDALF